MTSLYLKKFIEKQKCQITDLTFSIDQSIGERALQSRSLAPVELNHRDFDVSPRGASTFAFLLEQAPVKSPDTSPIVVFAHGTGNDSIFPHIELFRQLLNLGLSVYSFDLPGHGIQSTSFLGPSQVKEVMACALRQIKEARPRAPLHGLGYSLGGAQLVSAPESRKILNSLTLVATPYQIKVTSESILGELAALTQGEFYAQRRHYGWPGLVPAMGKFRRSEFPIRFAAPYDRPGSYVPKVAKIIEDLDVVAALQHWRLPGERGRLPLQLIYSERDYVVPIEQGELLAKGCQGVDFFRLRRPTHYTLLLGREVPSIVLSLIQKSGQ